MHYRTLGCVDIYLRRARKSREAPNELGDPTPTTDRVCCDFTERRLCIHRRGGVAPPSLNANSVALPNLII